MIYIQMIYIQFASHKTAGESISSWNGFHYAERVFIMPFIMPNEFHYENSAKSISR